MRIIQEGSLWWIDLELTCAGCAAVVQLERGDEGSVWWVPTSDANRVAITCPFCRSTLEASKPQP